MSQLIYVTTRKILFSRQKSGIFETQERQRVYVISSMKEGNEQWQKFTPAQHFHLSLLWDHHLAYSIGKHINSLIFCSNARIIVTASLTGLDFTLRSLGSGLPPYYRYKPWMSWIAILEILIKTLKRNNNNEI